MDILELILDGLPRSLMAREQVGATKPIQLLPKCINLAQELEKCHVTTNDGNTLENGTAVMSYAVRRIQNTAWSASAMIGLATVLREISIPQEALDKILNKMLRKLEASAS